MTLDVKYDFVIVGAGSAGCRLANRRSADPGIKVLAIETAGRDTNSWIHIPAFKDAIRASTAPGIRRRSA